MSSIRIRTLVSSLAIVVATPALAQVTPEEVWQSWQGLATGMGYTLTATEARQGDRLVLDNVVYTASSATMNATAPMGQIVMRDRGDGTVEVSMPAAFDVLMAIDEPGRDPVRMQMKIGQPGLTMVVSGNATNQRYAYQAQSLSIALSEIAVKGEGVPMTMEMVMGDVAGDIGLGKTDVIRSDYTVKAGSLTLNASAKKPDGDGTTEMAATVADIEMSFDGTLPENVTAGSQLPELLAAGLNGKGAYRTGAVTASVKVDDAGNDLDINAAATGSSTDFGLTASGMSYSATARGIDVAFAGSQIPFPDLRITLAEQTLGLTMPMVKSETPADFGVVLRLVDLVVPDSVWGMFDPMGQLPHDPATLVLDAKGKVTMFMDLGTPEAAQPGAVPGQFESARIDALQLKAAGANLTGTGAFDFDNTDMETFPGMPRPAGTVELNLTGGNALLDSLVAMGLVPQDQVMGFRMMLALFARPGEGPDSLTSKIEITPEGAIFANGQRIQ